MLTIELPLYLLKETIPAFDTYVYIEVIEEAGGVYVCGADRSNEQSNGISVLMVW